MSWVFGSVPLLMYIAGSEVIILNFLLETDNTPLLLTDNTEMLLAG